MIVRVLFNVENTASYHLYGPRLIIARKFGDSEVDDEARSHIVGR